RPIQVTIRVGSEPNKIVPITDENWRVGIALNTEVPIGQTATIQLVANGVASHIVANGQFDESDVYQFDFSFDQIKLEIPANQGRKDQAYQAMVTWNLVTGP
ncbi:WxL domain-containing protein, partial [Enterococcus faecalis]|nr:WxL domain-containing protein [Enterococcus faecalis]